MSLYDEKINLYINIDNHINALNANMASLKENNFILKKELESIFIDEFFSKAKDIPGKIINESNGFIVSFEDENLLNFIKSHLNALHDGDFYGDDISITVDKEKIVIHFYGTALVKYKKKYNLKILNLKNTLAKLTENLNKQFKLLGLK